MRPSRPPRPDRSSARPVLDRIGGLRLRAQGLRESAGTGTVVANLAAALTGLFGSVAVAIVALVISRDELRARLRAAGSKGIPLLAEAAAVIAAYLTAEQAHGRIAPDADVHTLAPTLVGAAHLLFASAGNTEPPTMTEVTKVVAAVVGGVVREG
ncbi:MULTISPECIES: TetR/AcrR family transcriptional regulator [unclassified Streptomyces]|uniref:TetR/AcrR family transcriptional regulator n=1 Tax=unclassified Streptomyces TaxID=2593676 RepID=UPI0003A75FEC|nr:TetR/AcrR family transcriptional regulator [Streptomyces sp. 303MFCol5.2]